jgi:stress response protein YsnF
MVETDEEAIITKSAHIAEEVEINRRGSDRVETVRGTVRRQQIDVERTPGERERTSTAADRSRRDDKG